MLCIFLLNFNSLLKNWSFKYFNFKHFLILFKQLLNHSYRLSNFSLHFSFAKIIKQNFHFITIKWTYNIKDLICIKKEKIHNTCSLSHEVIELECCAYIYLSIWYIYFVCELESKSEVCMTKTNESHNWLSKEEKFLFFQMESVMQWFLFC